MATQFSDTVVDQAWNRAGGRCECERVSHNHGRACRKQLSKGSQGKETPMGWETHHLNANGPATLSNCQILCQECHKATRTYGG